jgi:hypothetical protein
LYAARVSYSVLFRRFPLDRLDELAPIVRQVYGGTDFDARTKIRRGWGFLEREATEEVARRVAESVPGCFAVENQQLRPLSEPRAMTGFQFTEAGFVPDGAEAIPWSDICIVAAGGLAEEIVRRETTGKEANAGKMMLGLGVFLTTGIPMGLFGGKKPEVQTIKSNRWLTFASVVTRQGQQFAIALDHVSFNGLGAKRQLQAIVNFRILITELQQRTPAQLNYGARFVLASQSLSLANYTSVTDYENELSWMFNASLLPE